MTAEPTLRRNRLPDGQHVAEKLFLDDREGALLALSEQEKRVLSRPVV